MSVCPAFPQVIHVVRLCGPLHIKPAAVRYIFLCITPVDCNKYPSDATSGVKAITCTQTSHVPCLLHDDVRH